MRFRRMEINRMRLGLLGVAILGVFSAVGLLATNFQIYNVNGQYAEAKWPGSNPNLTWNLNFTALPSNVNENGSGVTPQTVLGNAFNAWHSAAYNSSAATNIAFTFGSASTTLFPQTPAIDCQNVIGFADTANGAFPSGVIAVTTIATITNGEVPSQCTSNVPPACSLAVCIVDGDIMFNPTPPVPGTLSGTGGFRNFQSHEQPIRS